MEIITSNRGMPQAHYLGYAYRKYRENSDSVVTWVCVKQRNLKCKGSVKTKSDQILKETDHQCGAPDEAKLEVRKQIYKAKKRARKESVPISKIYSKELGDLHNRGHGFATEMPSTPSLKRSNKSSGDVTSSRTSSFTTTSATTTSCTTSSITTTSLTTVSVTTTFSTATTPSTSIFSSVYLPSTSGFQTSFIKEEMDIGLDEINSEPDQDDFAELESTDQINQYGNEAEGNSCEEDDSGEREEEALSDVLHTTDSFDSELRNILTDNIFKFCDINPTFSQIPPEIPSPRHSSEPQSTVKLKYFELEQKLRLYYLKTMIRKEEELMNIKIQLYKAQLIREKAEAENNRIINTRRMDNLNIENKMLNLQLQILVK